MTQYSKINKGYKYIFTNIDVFSKYAYAFPLKSKKIQDIKPCFEKIFKNNKPKFIWSDKEPAFLSKEMQQFFKDNTVKILTLVQASSSPPIPASNFPARSYD